MQSACPHMVLAHDHGSAFGNARVKSCDVRRHYSRSCPCTSRLQNRWRSCGGAVASAEGPGLIRRSCRAIILGPFPEPKTPGAHTPGGYTLVLTGEADRGTRSVPHTDARRLGNADTDDAARGPD